MAVRITIAVSANVIAIWLVTVKAIGNRPKPLQNKMNMKMVKINGKNLRPAGPAVMSIMPPMNSYDNSASDCARVGTMRPLETARVRKSESETTTITIHSEWLVNEM